MINPYRGVLLDNNYYEYVSESFRFQIPLGNQSQDGQGKRSFSSVNGSYPEVFTITLSLDNNYTVRAGSSEVGSTTWLGVSRLEYLSDALGGTGDSMPVYFVSPFGATFSVVPTGALDVSFYNPSNPRDASAEFYVSLTLEATE